MTDTPKQWRMVPVEPSGAMQADGRDALEPFVGTLKQPVDNQWHLARLVWSAMLAATPALALCAAILRSRGEAGR